MIEDDSGLPVFPCRNKLSSSTVVCSGQSMVAPFGHHCRMHLLRLCWTRRGVFPSLLSFFLDVLRIYIAIPMQSSYSP